jgi:hypothetical protein
MLTYLDKKCAGDRKLGECQDGDCEASEDYTLEIIDAIREGFDLCCGSSYKKMVASRDGRMYLYPKDYFTSDYVMPCVDADKDLVVTNDTLSHRASHLLTFPRACELPRSDKDVGCLLIANNGRGANHVLTSPRACEVPPCEITMPHYGSRGVRRDGDDDDDLPATVDTVAEASYDDDSDDACVCLDRSRYSSGIEEV